MDQIHILPVGPIAANCCLVWDEASKAGLIIDPGEEATRIQREVGKIGFGVQAILLTHAHLDHVGAAARLQKEYGCAVWLHEEDQFLLDMLDVQTQSLGFPPIPKPQVQHFRHEDRLESLEVIHTPGHSPGSSCFLLQAEERPILFSGDTLFKEGIGRTDLWGGDGPQIQNSIRERLFSLPDATLVLPGHGPKTTIGHEKRCNSFLKGSGRK